MAPRVSGRREWIPPRGSLSTFEWHSYFTTRRGNKTEQREEDAERERRQNRTGVSTFSGPRPACLLFSSKLADSALFIETADVRCEISGLYDKERNRETTGKAGGSNFARLYSRFPLFLAPSSLIGIDSLCTRQYQNFRRDNSVPFVVKKLRRRKIRKKSKDNTRGTPDNLSLSL